MKEKALLNSYSLHNTETTRNVFNIILWRLLKGVTCPPELPVQRRKENNREKKIREIL